MQGPETYRDPAKSFTLFVPDGWDVHERYAGTLVTVARQPSTPPGFAANVNVVEYDNVRALDARGLVDESIDAMSTLLTDFVLLEQDEDDVTRLVFTFRQGIYGLTAEQRYVLDDGVYYVVTGTMTNGEYADQRETVAAIIDSFTAADA
jgi:hypothetical protein